MEERGREKEISMWRETLISCLLEPNLGMCPDQESNRRYFDVQDNGQLPEPHQPKQFHFSFKDKCILELGYSLQRVHTKMLIIAFLGNEIAGIFFFF